MWRISTLVVLSAGTPTVTDFSALVLVTDFFVARGHASDVHLGTFGSQNQNGTDHWVKPAKIQVCTTPLTITMPGYHLILIDNIIAL